jgi:signal transduction histidine kinase
VRCGATGAAQGSGEGGISVVTFRGKLILVVALLLSALTSAFAGLVWAVQETSARIERSDLAHEGYSAALLLDKQLADYGRKVLAIELGEPGGAEERRGIEARCEAALDDIRDQNAREQDLAGEVEELLEEDDHGVSEEDECRNVEKLSATFAALRAMVGAAEAAAKEGDERRSKDLSKEALALLDDELVAPLLLYREEEHREVHAAQEGAKSYTRLSRWLAVGMGCAAALGIAMASVAVSLLRTMGTRIDALAAGTRELGRGNLDFRLDVQGEDELSELASEQNRMAGQISALHNELDARARRIEEAYAFQKDFFAMMTHELRAPLNSILGFCELLLEGEPPLGEQGQKNVRWIATSAERMLERVNSILLLAKLEAGRMEVVLATFALSPVLEGVMAGLRAQIKALGRERDIEVVLSVAEDTPAVLRSDEEKVRHILTNLTDNAAKFTEAGKIEVRVEGTGDGGASIAVADTGIGVPEDAIGSIFNLYTVGSRRGSGSGIGLAVAQRFARLLGGDIHASSKVGEGSSFTLALPAAPDA